jgi:hypothetical protein
MKRVGLPFSGEYDFVETVMYWPINHMVAPKDQPWVCRMPYPGERTFASLTGFYLPGRDYDKTLDTLGAFCFWALFAVFFMVLSG